MTHTNDGPVGDAAILAAIDRELRKDGPLDGKRALYLTVRDALEARLREEAGRPGAARDAAA